MSGNKIRRSHKKNSFVAPLIIICIAVTFSALAAALWQLATPEPPEQPPLELDPSIVSQFDEGSIAVTVAVTPSEPPAVSEQPPQEPSDTQDESSSEVSSPPESSSEPVSERVTSQYFDDAVFIGDSISVGIKLYDIMQNAEVYASVGISLENIFTNKAVKLEDGSSITIFEALPGKDFKKAYIMLGANSLMSSHDALIKQYGRVIDEVKSRLDDDCIIYIQSVLPVYEEVFHQKYPHNTTTNADIESFNLLLRGLADEKGAHYLDVASVIKDENGSLPPESTSDGLHIGSELYIKWFDYLKTHTVA